MTATTEPTRRTTAMAPRRVPVGRLLRTWRERRHRSQLDVSIAAETSARHLSFIETGRATPSRAMIERLCDELEVPLRDRNALHLAAGFAPPHTERAFTDLGAARGAIEAVLTGHEPNPALAVNVRWELLAANRAMALFLDQLPDALREPPVNVLRVTLHPDGLASGIRNYEQWRAHACRRVRRQLDRTAADGLADLLAEIESYPVPEGPGAPAGPAGGGRHAARDGGDVDADDSDAAELVTPMRLRTEHGELSLLYAVTVFGSPRDVTLDEVAIETFFPADAATAAALRALDLG